MEYDEERVNRALNRVQAHTQGVGRCVEELLAVYRGLGAGGGRRGLVRGLGRKVVAAVGECARLSPLTAQSAAGRHTTTQGMCLRVVRAVRAFGLRCGGAEGGGDGGVGEGEGLVRFVVGAMQNAASPSVRAWLCLFLGCGAPERDEEGCTEEGGEEDNERANTTQAGTTGGTTGGGVVCVRALMARARDKSPVVRVAAARAAGAWAVRSAVLRRLVVVLMRTDPAAEVRLAALRRAWGGWAVCAVCERTRDSAPEVRRAAFQRAAVLGPGRVAGALPGEAVAGMVRRGMCDADGGVREACACFAAAADLPQRVVEELCGADGEGDAAVDAIAARLRGGGGAGGAVSLGTAPLLEVIAAGQRGALTLSGGAERLRREGETFRRAALRAVRACLRAEGAAAAVEEVEEVEEEKKERRSAALAELVAVPGSTPGVVRERTRLALLLCPEDPGRALAWGAGSGGGGDGSEESKAALFVAAQELLTQGGSGGAEVAALLAEAGEAARSTHSAPHLRVAAVALLATASNTRGSPTARDVALLARDLCAGGAAAAEVRRAAVGAVFDVALVQGCAALATEAEEAAEEEVFGALLRALGDDDAHAVAAEGVPKLLLHGKGVTQRRAAVGASMLLTALALRGDPHAVAATAAFFAALPTPAALCAATLSALRYLLFAGAGRVAAERLIAFAWEHCPASTPVPASAAAEHLALPVAFPSARHCLLALLLCDALADTGGVAIPALLAPFLPAALRRARDHPALSHILGRVAREMGGACRGGSAWSAALRRLRTQQQGGGALHKSLPHNDDDNGNDGNDPTAHAIDRYIEAARAHNARRRASAAGAAGAAMHRGCGGSSPEGGGGGYGGNNFNGNDDDDEEEEEEEEEDIIIDDSETEDSDDPIDPPSDDETRRRDREAAGIEDIDTPSDMDDAQAHESPARREGVTPARRCLLFASEALRPLLCAAEAVLGAEALPLSAQYLSSERAVTHVVLPAITGGGRRSPADTHALLCGLLTAKWVVPAAWLEESLRARAFLPERDWGVRIARHRPLGGIRLCLTPHSLAQLPTNAARREVKEVLEAFGGVTLLSPRYAAYSPEAVVIRGDKESDGGYGYGYGSGDGEREEGGEEEEERRGKRRRRRAEGGKVLTWGEFLDKLVLLGKRWMTSGLE